MHEPANTDVAPRRYEHFAGRSQDDVTRDNSQRPFLAQRSVATLLGHCFEWLQHCFNIATLSCAKNRRCESSRVTSPLVARSEERRPYSRAIFARDPQPVHLNTVSTQDVLLREVLTIPAPPQSQH